MTGSDSTAPPAPPLDLFDPAPVAVALFMGPRLLLAYTNAEYKELYGERPLGVPAREALRDLEQEAAFDWAERVMETGETFRYTSESPVRIRDRHGRLRDRYFTVSMSRATARDGGGGPEERGVLFVALEITPEITARKQIRKLAEKRRRALQRYESLVTAATQLVWVADPSGRVTESSPYWEGITGRSGPEIRGDGWLDTAHPEDRPGLAAAWEQAVEEVPELFRHTYRLGHADGSYRHYELRAVPVRESGRVVEWVGACADVEDRWWQDRRKDLMARVSSAVTESTRVEDALAALGEAIVPELADGCGLYLFTEITEPVSDEPLVINRVAVSVRDGLVTEDMAPAPPRTERVERGSAFDRAVREQRPVHRRPAPGAAEPGDVPPGTLTWANAVGVHDIVMIPITVGDVVVSVLTAYSSGDRPPLGSAELSLIRDLIDQSKPSVGTILEYRRTQRISLALQRSLLTEPPRPDGLEIVARYEPSAMADEVGGDWYDSFVLPDGAVTLIIGDVAGHDLSAAITMGKMRNMLRGLVVDRQEPPGDILRRLDLGTQILNPEETTTTCILARIEHAPGGRRQLHYSVAGHPPPLLVGPEGTARYLDQAQDVLLGGLAPDLVRSSSVEPLPPGCTVFLYTDGLIERPGQDIDTGLAWLRRKAARLATVPLADFCGELVAEAMAESNDDIAVVAVRMPEGDSGGPSG
ncbi:SpoIIE family protein phosphatase [Streptomyces sp. F63]|uniref:SpoIIE family protein phosphatase n=1 Tax=Streptomyces sp. F63 TaxID=2824887 RepID=UPI001B3886A8|nr:SpoIIE family protein phosphatase [Streptomyces sp. F63]MBQ0987840.1 SpoIIE family protein phosphatase [Streptomyces sp. F63]